MFVDMREKIIAYCDSLSGSGHRYYVVSPLPVFFFSLSLTHSFSMNTHTPRYVKGMFKYLQDEMWDKKRERMDTVKWQLKSRLQVRVSVVCVANVYSIANPKSPNVYVLIRFHNKTTLRTVVYLCARFVFSLLNIVNCP